MEPEEVLARPHRHHDLLERAVAGALADAIDRALDLAGAGADGSQGVGDGHAEVVVAVDRQYDLVDVGDVVLEVPDQRRELTRYGVTDGIGDVDRRCPRLDRRFDDLGEEPRLGARGVFGRELDVVAEVTCPRYFVTRAADDLALCHSQLVLAVDLAGGQKDVDARPGGVTNGIPGSFDVAAGCPCQPRDDRSFDLAGDGRDCFEIAGRGDREAGFDDVHAEFGEGAGELELLLDAHARPRRLLAVA